MGSAIQTSDVWPGSGSITRETAGYNGLEQTESMHFESSRPGFGSLSQDLGGHGKTSSFPGHI